MVRESKYVTLIQFKERLNLKMLHLNILKEMP